MADNVAPSINPADAEDFAGGLRQIMQKFIAQSVDNMMPVIVISFDEDRNEARVQPAIKILDTGGNLTSRGQFTVPVFTFGGGGALMRFRLNPGDLGWIEANDRDISLFLQTLEESAPNTLRKHQFEDAVLFPDAMRTFTAAQEDKDDNALAVFQTSDGAIKLSILETGFKMRGNLELIGDFTHTGDTMHTGDTDHVGEVSASGVIHSDIDVTATMTNTSLVGHDHDYLDNNGTADISRTTDPTNP